MMGCLVGFCSSVLRKNKALVLINQRKQIFENNAKLLVFIWRLGISLCTTCVSQIWGACCIFGTGVDSLCIHMSSSERRGWRRGPMNGGWGRRGGIEKKMTRSSLSPERPSGPGVLQADWRLPLQAVWSSNRAEWAFILSGWCDWRVQGWGWGWAVQEGEELGD